MRLSDPLRCACLSERASERERERERERSEREREETARPRESGEREREMYTDTDTDTDTGTGTGTQKLHKNKTIPDVRIGTQHVTLNLSTEFAHLRIPAKIRQGLE